MQLNPARGRKLPPNLFYRRIITWFMQLNPARGRKLSQNLTDHRTNTSPVYAAQPREGTETLLGVPFPTIFRPRFMQLNPARGRKQHLLPVESRRKPNRFMQLNPARGRKREYTEQCIKPQW